MRPETKRMEEDFYLSSFEGKPAVVPLNGRGCFMTQEGMFSEAAGAEKRDLGGV